MLINVILGIDCEIYLVIVLQARWANCSEPSINGFGKREKTFKFTVRKLLEPILSCPIKWLLVTAKLA